MDEEIERLLVSVRADTGAFARDLAEMRASLEGPLAAGVEKAGRALESALLRAVRTGKLGFEDLKKIALSAMARSPPRQFEAVSALRWGVAARGSSQARASYWRACSGCPGGRPAGRWRPAALT